MCYSIDVAGTVPATRRRKGMTMEAETTEEQRAEAAKEARLARARNVESEASIVLAQAMVAHYKGAIITKIDAGGNWNWQGEVAVQLRDGTKLSITVDATLPGDEDN